MDRRDFVKGIGVLGSIVASGGGALLLESCGSGTSGSTGTSGGAPSKPTPGGSLTLATQEGPVDLDPHAADLYSSIQVYDTIYSRLVELTPNFGYTPSLATKWVQDDEKTWTFDLVENAVFHNGEHFTANDVKYSLDRVKTKSNSSYFQSLASTEVLSPYKVRLHLSTTSGVLLAGLAGGGDIMNEKAATSADPKLHPCGTGPYRMTDWVLNDHLTLQRWDQYFRKDRPYLDTITFKAVADDSVRLAGLQNGQFGWIQSVPPQQQASLQSSNDVRRTAAQPYFPDRIEFNCAKPPFNDVRVRQAVAWAIDRKAIAKLVYFTAAVPASEPTSPPSPWYTGVDPYKNGPDIAKAKSLLKQAGVRDLRIVFAGNSDLPTQTKTGEILKSQLAKVGIQMEIQSLPHGPWLQGIIAGNYQISTTYFSVTYDPGFYYTLLVHSKSKANRSQFVDPTIDELIMKFVNTPDMKGRKAVYPDLVKAVAEQVPVLTLDNELTQYWTRPNVHGAEVIPTLDIRAEDLWLAH